MKIFLPILFAFSSALAYGSCPTHIRFIHGQPFKDGDVKVNISGKKMNKMLTELSFRETSKYLELKPGIYTVQFTDVATGENLGSKEAVFGPNLANTVVLGGPAQGPVGMRNGNSSPLIVADDITPPVNPTRWKGTWYRMSETNVVIDLRISDGINPTNELGRLSRKENRSTYQIGDFPTGIYQFNPTLVGSSEPFFNPALEPARLVELREVSIEGGENIDIIALGNFLGKAPNSLDLTYVKYKTEINDKGCYVLKQ